MFELTVDNFQEEVLNSTTPVLVDFWAPWCGPCRMQGPIIEKLAEELKEASVKIAKVNIDENVELAKRYNIFSIPTMSIFKDGEVKEQMVGVHQIDDLKERLERYL